MSTDKDRDHEDAVLDHLQQVAYVKKAMLQTALRISSEFPSEATTLLRAIKHLTQSADRLLGDTVVTAPSQ